MEFSGKMYISAALNKSLLKALEEVAQKVVEVCASKYEFSAEEAMRVLDLDSLKVLASKKEKKLVVKDKLSKPSFPLPWSGLCNDSWCQALRQNNGLYTQCQSSVKSGSSFCKGCSPKEGSVPEYGTIQQRMEAGPMEYIDPKGRKPTSYTKVMKKYKLTEEQVTEEALKFGITVNPIHFSVPEDSKRGRPKGEPKEKKEGKKGRPKKSKKVIQIEGEGEDLFASLVASANAESESEVEEDAEIVLKPAPKAKKASVDKEAQKAEKEAKLAAQKAEKEAKLEAEKAEKEAKKAALQAEKEAKKAADEAKKAEIVAEKEAKKAAEKAEKEAKLAAQKAEKEAKLEAEKTEKEAKKAAEKEAKKEENKPKKSKAKKPAAAAAEVEADEEPDIVKKIEFEGKKYLKSKKTGIIYDYNEYVNNSEQVVVGKWNESKNEVEFSNAEESEDEYEV